MHIYMHASTRNTTHKCMYMHMHASTHIHAVMHTLWQSSTVFIAV